MSIISRIDCRTVRLPQNAKRIPLNSDDDCSLDVADVLFIDMATKDGPTGIGFTMTSGPGIGAIRSLIENDLAPLVIGEDALSHEKLWAKVQQASRKVGFRGMVARSWAAIDMALWDIKAKVANLPLWKLLGGAKPSAPVFLTSRDAASAGKQASKMGVMGVMLELGGCDAEADLAAVHLIRDSIGEDVWLSVTADGKYDVASALALGHVFEEEIGLDLFEEPLPPWDLAGYRRLSERLEQTFSTSAGIESSACVDEWVRSGAVKVLRPDLFRIGGITPWLRIAAMLEHQPIALGVYRCPEVGVHLACGLQNVQSVEMVPWMQGLFAEPLKIEKGRIVPPTLPGLGIGG